MLEIAVHMWIGASIVFSNGYRRLPLPILIILLAALIGGGTWFLGLNTPLLAQVFGHGFAISSYTWSIFYPKTRTGEWIQKKLLDFKEEP